jgi:hypothetical protein
MIRVLTMLIVTTLAAHGAEQVQLKMTSGEVIPGEIVSQDDKQITLKRTIGGKKGPMSVTMTYEREKIAEVIPMPSPKDEYEKKAPDVPKTAKDQLAFAKWCQENALTDQAVDHAKKAAGLDATDADSRSFLNDLGWYELDGTWLNEAEYMAKTGKVKYNGKLMTAKEAEEAKAKAAEKQAANEVEEKTNRLASIDKRIAANKEDAAEIDQKIQKINSDISAAESDAKAMETAKQNYDSAEKALESARAQSQAQTNPALAAANTANLANLQKALDEAQAAYNKTKAKGTAAAALIARCKAQSKDLEQKKASLTKKSTDLQAERSRAAQDLQKATEEAAKPATKP